MYCADLEWLLTESSAALGERSSFNSFVRTLQSGHATAHYDPSNADPFTDWQVRMGPRGQGAFARHRRVWRLWCQLPTEHQRTLTYRYTWTCQVPLKNPDGTERWEDSPQGLKSEVGVEVAGMVVHLAKERGCLAEVLQACEQHHSQAIEEIVATATEAVRAAHTAYYELETAEWLSGKPKPVEGQLEEVA